MTRNHVDDVEHWRERAAQMRVLATTMNQIEAQAIMARLAEDYDKLADRAELRANGEVPPKRLVGRISWRLSGEARSRRGWKSNAEDVGFRNRPGPGSTSVIAVTPAWRSPGL
jgi:hypothetical protein